MANNEFTPESLLKPLTNLAVFPLSMQASVLSSTPPPELLKEPLKGLHEALKTVVTPLATDEIKAEWAKIELALASAGRTGHTSGNKGLGTFLSKFGKTKGVTQAPQFPVGQEKDLKKWAENLLA